MASVKLIFAKNKPNKKTGECYFFMRVTHNRKQKELKIGKCKPEHWNFDINLPKKNCPFYQDILVLIDKRKRDANKLILELESNDLDFTSNTIVDTIVKKNKISSKTVLQYFDENIERFKNSNRIGYANIFKSTSNSLKTFNKGKDFSFGDVDYNFLSRFEEHHLKNEVKPNSIFVYLRTFRTLLNNAVKDGIVKSDYNPYKDYPLAKFRRIKTIKRTLSEDEMKKIIESEFEQDTAIFHAKNYFLFSYYNRGINFIDLSNLKWKNIQNNRLFYTRSKTKGHFNIELLEPVIKILEYYKVSPNLNENSFIFPILNETHVTAQQIDNRIDRVLKLVNKNLKAMGEKLEITTKITTYVARHTFANALKRGGAKTAEISEAMGHVGEEITQIYLDSFENEKLDNLTKSILI
jgi:site-specific recombinase XerD